MSPHDIDGLKRGGHDILKLHAAFHAAKTTAGRPTVILAKTKKGYGMGAAGQSRMIAHQAKKLDMAALKAFRDGLKLPLSDDEVERLDFYRPEESSPELAYLRKRRKALGGYMPERRRNASPVAVPKLETYAQFALEGQSRETSTTVTIVRLLGALLKDEALGPRIVPIVADEARTFGMAALFRQIGIYSPQGQLYEPEDAGSMLAYREARNGQLLEEGITEAGALSSWVAAATSYSTHGLAMLPFYIFYSMFGFQRVGDLIWAAADQRARGFLIGATAGRTTLSGEGLQHQNGSSHVIAATIPNCRAYDPAFAYELAVIFDRGARRMMENERDEFYYITTMNENYAQASMPAGVEDDIVKGMYPFVRRAAKASSGFVRLLGSGAILREVIEASRMLEAEWGVASEVWSVTSYSELARDARSADRHHRLNPTADPVQSHLAACLPGEAPIIAASDYVCAYPQLIAAYVEGPFTALGTDGFGRSDTRAALRAFFEVDRHHVVIAALAALAARGETEKSRIAEAIATYGIDTRDQAPWTR